MRGACNVSGLFPHHRRTPISNRPAYSQIQPAEGLAHVTLLVVQAPLPSAERVASAVELAMDMSKRGLGTVARECYYYVQVCCALPCV